MERPENISDEHLELLDDLRESGVTNMLGATPFIQEEFMLDRNEASEILSYWMDSFGDPSR